LCESNRLTEVLDLGLQALTGVFPKSSNEDIPSGPLTLIKCMDCGLVQLAHTFDLQILYGENYGYRSGLNPSMVRHLSNKVQKIQGQVKLAPGDLVIDIGSNDGTTLGAYTVPGLRRVGMDPTGDKFRQYYAPGVELIADFFAAHAIERLVGARKAKVITSIAMFYDLDRPVNFVREVMEVLDDDGLWVFEQSYLPSMLACGSYDTICHEHLEYYSLKQIHFFTQQLDLKIVDVEFSDANGGSFSVAVAKRAAPYPEATSFVEETLADETAAGLDTTEPFEELKRRMQNHRAELLVLLEEIQSMGKKVLGYGASTKGNVLLQYCGIDAKLLPLIAEVNEDKFGSFTPGTRIPIVSEQEARAMQPDYFLVLPWHFRKGIVRKEAGYLQAGGRLIFPLPTLDIVTATAIAIGRS